MSNSDSDFNMINNSIILSSCLFGSVYLNIKSIEQINMLFLQKKSIPNRLIILNSLCFT